MRLLFCSVIVGGVFFSVDVVAECRNSICVSLRFNSCMDRIVIHGTCCALDTFEAVDIRHKRMVAAFVDKLKRNEKHNKKLVGLFMALFGSMHVAAPASAQKKLL